MLTQQPGCQLQREHNAKRQQTNTSKTKQSLRQNKRERLHLNQFELTVKKKQEKGIRHGYSDYI